MVAVLWYHGTDDMHPDSWMIHVAAAEQYRKRWMTLRIIGECLGLPFAQGASRLYAHITSDGVAKMWAKLGFTLVDHESEGPVAYKERDEWEIPPE